MLKTKRFSALVTAPQMEKIDAIARELNVKRNSVVGQLIDAATVATITRIVRSREIVIARADQPGAETE